MIIGTYDNGIGNNSHSKLLIHANGADDDETFTDESPVGRTVINSIGAPAAGKVKVKTGTKKFGTGSAYLPGSAGQLGTGAFLYSADSTDWDLGRADYTVHLWVKIVTLATGFGILVIQRQGGVSNFYSNVNQANGFPDLLVINDSTWSVNISSGVNIDDAAFHHIAWTKKADTFRLFIDGALKANADFTGTYQTPAIPLDIGAYVTSNRWYGMVCYFDEIQVVKGRALWTRSFTPPNRAA